MHDLQPFPELYFIDTQSITNPLIINPLYLIDTQSNSDPLH